MTNSGAATVRALDADNRRAIMVGDGATARVCDIDGQADAVILRGHEATITRSTFSLDGARVLTASQDGTARLWDPATGRCLYVLHAHDGPVQSVTFSPDGLFAMTATWGEAKVWDVRSGERVAVLATPVKAKTASALRCCVVALAAGGRRALTCWDDPVLRLWDVESGEQIRRFAGRDSRVHYIADLDLDPSGTRLLSCEGWIIPGFGHHYPVALWHADSDDEAVELEAHNIVSHRNSCLAFSPVGTLAVTGADDGCLRVWHSDTGQMLAELKAGESGVRNVAFSSDGTRCLAFYQDESFRDWDVSAWMA